MNLFKNPTKAKIGIGVGAVLITGAALFFGARRVKKAIQKDMEELECESLNEYVFKKLGFGSDDGLDDDSDNNFGSPEAYEELPDGDDSEAEAG